MFVRIYIAIDFLFDVDLMSLILYIGNFSIPDLNTLYSNQGSLFIVHWSLFIVHCIVHCRYCSSILLQYMQWKLGHFSLSYSVIKLFFKYWQQSLVKCIINFRQEICPSMRFRKLHVLYRCTYCTTYCLTSVISKSRYVD